MYRKKVEKRNCRKEENLTRAHIQTKKTGNEEQSIFKKNFKLNLMYLRHLLIIFKSTSIKQIVNLNVKLNWKDKCILIA